MIRSDVPVQETTTIILIYVLPISKWNVLSNVSFIQCCQPYSFEKVGTTIDDFIAVFNNKAQEFLQATIFIVGIACRLNFGPIYKQDTLELC